MTSALTLGPLPLSGTDANGVRWSVTGFDGWGSPSSTVQVVQKPRQDWGWAGASFLTARYLSVRGMIVAPTPELLTLSLDTLYAAVTLTDSLLTVAEAGQSRSLMVRRQDWVTPTRLNDTIAQYAFQVVALDGRKLGGFLTGSTLLPSTTGGLTVPFTVPFSIAATSTSGQITLTNTGNTSGAVTMRVDGPCPGPAITHVSSGQQLVFASSLVLQAGEWLDIDMDARTVMANGQASRSGYITSRGWSAFDPGDNTWEFTAASFMDGARLTVNTAPASL